MMLLGWQAPHPVCKTAAPARLQQYVDELEQQHHNDHVTIIVAML